MFLLAQQSRVWWQGTVLGQEQQALVHHLQLLPHRARTLLMPVSCPGGAPELACSLLRCPKPFCAHRLQRCGSCPLLWDCERRGLQTWVFPWSHPWAGQGTGLDTLPKGS